ncbi:MAG: hypothetical protein AAB441_00765 [Patescibacteria group bacterium]
MNFREKFLRIYANLPLNQRSEIVVVLGDEPMTWNATRVEIENDTEKGKEILKKLVDLQIIK